MLSAFGGAGGLALMWLHAKRGLRPRTPLRTAALVAGAALALYLTGANAVLLVQIFLVVGWPERFAYLFLPDPAR